MPASFGFSTEISVRITDINYGGHVGNDSILSIIHEARMQFLKSLGLAEKTGDDRPGLIMRDVTIEFKKEAFYGDVLSVQVAAVDVEKASYDIVYRLQRNQDTIAVAKTGMVSFDYAKKRIVALPPEIVALLTSTTV
jgi:YbgC/YbaW family acyl-CoA thioester hydrolase